MTLFDNIHRRPLQALFSALAIALAIALTGTLSGCSSKVEYTAHDIQNVMRDLEFTLTNEQGQTVTADSFDGELKMLFFGYTNCPDICPATMARIRAALGGLDAEQREAIDVLFVSVDPERDTPDKIASFTDRFGPGFTGLTGTEKQLRALNKRYRATYGYSEPNDHGFYRVSHSSAIYVFGAQDQARLLINQRESVDDMATDLKTLLATQG